MLLNTLFPFGMSVGWLKASNFQFDNEQLKHWILHTGSLTERLEALTSAFSVELLGQGHAPLDSSEQKILKLELCNSEQWQVREVILHGDGQPWVFARSVIPSLLCDTSLANLGNNPLGKRIFNDEKFKRSDFEVGSVNTHPFTKRQMEANTLLARRSLFGFEGQSVLVAEAFLPDCPCYLRDKD
ncbi:chorismate--pyruvate lyase family protein [Agaribacter flavus]|uniref:Probable chorismate pyruvate-lyase n=1 Tax=Agaribacter flavus TaxID=1902781 RepID=A0ABV7FRW3_9ALTE